MIKSQVFVLGVTYSITIKRFADDPLFAAGDCAGYCRASTREIVLLDIKTAPGNEQEKLSACLKLVKQNLRHEIVHAFLKESGLRSNGLQYEGPWNENEEMVDWIAVQGPKIYQAWREAGAL